MTVPRPGPDEFAPFYANYIAKVADVAEAARALRAQAEALRALLGAVSEDAAAFRYAPEKWSIKQVVGHMTDAERVFAYRLLRIARGDDTPLAGFDETEYAREAGSDRRTLEDLLAEWQSTRAATVALAQGLDAAAWPRRGSANNYPVSARALLYIILGHVEHHTEVLRTRYGVGSAGSAAR
jgi:uncharacterized damage-inducible protein DinB